RRKPLPLLCSLRTGHVVNATDERLWREPDAGNPHVRFDEGEGKRRSLVCASHSVLPSLLYWILGFAPRMSADFLACLSPLSRLHFPAQWHRHPSLRVWRFLPEIF